MPGLPAKSVRLDRTYRCVMPFRVRSLPSTMKPTACSVMFDDIGVTGMLNAGDGRWNILFDAHRGRLKEPNEEIGGRSARVLEHPGDGGAQIMEVTADQDGTVLSLTASGQYDAALVRQLAAGCDWIGGDDPATWPTEPLMP